MSYFNISLIFFLFTTRQQLLRQLMCATHYKEITAQDLFSQSQDADTGPNSPCVSPLKLMPRDG